MPTTIETKPADVVLGEDQTMVQFDCTASADASQPLEIVWWHEENRVYPDTDPRYTIDGDNSLFINVENATEDDLENYIGTYKCVASADLSGVATATAEFSVPGVTTPAREYCLIG